MKKIYSKILACILIAMLAVSVVSMVVPVKASESSVLSYFEQQFSFTDSTSFSKGFDGTFIDVRLMATSSAGKNEKVTLEVYVTKIDEIHTYTFYTDGLTKVYEDIYLGLKGGSDVRFTFSTESSATINISMSAES